MVSRSHADTRTVNCEEVTVRLRLQGPITLVESICVCNQKMFFFSVLVADKFVIFSWLHKTIQDWAKKPNSLKANLSIESEQVKGPSLVHEPRPLVSLSFDSFSIPYFVG